MTTTSKQAMATQILLWFKAKKTSASLKQTHDFLVAAGFMDDASEVGKTRVKSVLFTLVKSGKITVKTEKGIDIFYPNEPAQSLKTLPAKQPQPAGQQPSAPTVTVLVHVRAEKAQVYADALNDLSYLLAPPIAEMCADIGKAFTRALNTDDANIFTEKHA